MHYLDRTYKKKMLNLAIIVKFESNNMLVVNLLETFCTSAFAG